MGALTVSTGHVHSPFDTESTSSSPRHGHTAHLWMNARKLSICFMHVFACVHRCTRACACACAHLRGLTHLFMQKAHTHVHVTWYTNKPAVRSQAAGARPPTPTCMRRVPIDFPHLTGDVGCGPPLDTARGVGAIVQHACRGPSSAVLVGLPAVFGEARRREATRCRRHHFDGRACATVGAYAASQRLQCAPNVCRLPSHAAPRPARGRPNRAKT